MHPLRLIDYLLWWTAPTLLVGVVVMLWKRGLNRDFPFFFYYAVLQVCSDPILGLVHAYSYTAYYYAYYVHMGLSVLLSFAVLQEIFKDAFRPYENLRDLSVILFRWSALVVFLVAVMWAMNTAHNPDNGLVTDVMMLADRSVRLMQCGLVFFLLLFNTYLGIPHRSMLFGISLGFGFFAAVNMLVATGVSHHVNSVALSRVNSGAYLLAVIIWLGYTLVAAPSESKVREYALLRSSEWNSALDEIRVAPVDSILDTMDRTVERLLYGQDQAEVKVQAGPR
jgi:hypothetical protein